MLHYMLHYITCGQIQTDEHIEEKIEIHEDHSPELLRFLRAAEPLMVKELRKNSRTNAFDGKIYTVCYHHLSTA